MIAGTLEEAVFRLILYIAKRRGMGSKVNIYMNAFLGRDNYVISNFVLPPLG